MADGMCFDKYIDNPSGTATVVTNRNMIKATYKAKFDKILLREGGKIDYAVYHSKDKDSYYIHMKIPSEVIDEFYYDVVVQLFTTENKKKLNANLRNYAVKFFSNDPAFVYTFAHSFLKNKLFIEDLAPKMSKVALTKVATVKNPKDEVWYVKSLYFAYLTMEKYHLFSRSILNRYSSKYSSKALLSKITHASEKIEARQNAQAKMEKDRRKEKEAKLKEELKKQPKATNIIKTAITSKTSRNTKTVKTTKKVFRKS